MTGIAQINKAIAEMGRVVQENAASVDELASASNDTKAQAMQMQALVAKKTGIDYTQEKRGEEVGKTLRPVLSAGDNKNESILYCDDGEL